MLTDLPPEPPAIVRTAPDRPIPSRTVMVWGDAQSMAMLREQMTRNGWVSATGVLAGQSDALFLQPPGSITDDQITAFIGTINKGDFGKINAGYATTGNPQ